jgi:hypothetical protein
MLSVDRNISDLILLKDLDEFGRSVKMPLQ